ncbi:MAG: hypothetical protein ABUL60_34330 [Myxococcales bacterium]
MGWARSSFLLWLGIAVGAGCSGKYVSGPDDLPPSGSDAGGSTATSETSGGEPAAPSAGSSSAGTDASATSGGRTNGGSSSDNPSNEVTLNCGTWVRCDDSSACAKGEDCIALPGCERGICATPRLVCQLYCGSSACESAPVGLTRLRVSCPNARLDGFESSAGSGGYPPGYPM